MFVKTIDSFCPEHSRIATCPLSKIGDTLDEVPALKFTRDK